MPLAPYIKVQYLFSISLALPGIIKRRSVKPLHGSSTPPHSYAERPPLPATAHGWKIPLQRSDCGWAGVSAPFSVIALPNYHLDSFGQVLSLSYCKGLGAPSEGLPEKGMCLTIDLFSFGGRRLVRSRLSHKRFPTLSPNAL